MVVAEAHENELRHVARGLEFLDVVQENLGALDVRIVEIEAVVFHVGDAAQCGIAYRVDHNSVGARGLAVVHPVAVIAHGNAFCGRIGPDVTGGRLGGGINSFVVGGKAAPAVTVGPQLLNVVVGDCGGGPGVAVGADVAV